MRIAFLFAACVLATTALAQNIPSNPNKTVNGKREGKWTQLIDKDWKEISSPAQAVYYRIIEYSAGVPQGIVRDYFVSGKVQFEGRLLSENPDVNDGLCTWYLENGNKSKEAEYKNGVLDGKSIDYQNGKKYAEATFSKGQLAVDWMYFGTDYNSYYKTGNQLREVKQYARAEENLLKSKDAAVKEFGSASYQLRNSYWSLCYLYMDMDRGDKAEPAFQSAYNIQRNFRNNEEVHKDFLFFAEGLAKYLGDNGRLEGSVGISKIAAAERRRMKWFEDWGYYWDLKRIVDYSYRLGKGDSSAQYFEMIAPLLEKEENPYVGNLRDWTSYLISENGKMDRVEKLLANYITSKAQKGQKDAAYGVALTTYGKIMWSEGQNQKAIKSFTDARLALEPFRDNDKGAFIEPFYYYAQLCNGAKIYDAATDKLFAEYDKYNELYSADIGTRYRDGLTELATYSYYKKDYPKAEERVRKVLSLYEQQGETDNSDYRMLKVVLAGILEKAGKTAESEAMVKGMSKSKQKELIKDMGLANSDKVIEELGRYLQNTEYVKALVIFEKYNDILNSYYANKGDYSSLVSTDVAIAYCYRETGNFAKAEEILMAANTIANEKLPKTDRAYNLALWNTGEFYQMTGSLEQAEKFFRAALINLNETQTEKNKKENDEQYYNILGRLAGVYSAWGDYERAEKEIYRVLDYKYDVFGANSVEYATANFELGQLYHTMYLFANAEKIYNQVEPIFRKAGENTARYTSLLFAMAINYQVRGDYAKAEPMFLRVKDFQAATLGTRSAAYAYVITDLGVFYYHANQWPKAEAIYDELNKSAFMRIDNFFNSLSEKEKGNFYSEIQKGFNKFNSFGIHGATKNPAILGKMYDIQLATKGLLFRSTNKVRETILTGKDDSLKAQYDRWMNKKEILSRVYQMSDAEKKAAKVDERTLESQVNQLEKEITKKSVQFANLINTRPVWRQVQKNLKPGEAAIEMIRIHDAIQVYRFQYMGKGLSYDSIKDDYAVVSEVFSDRTPAYRAGIKEGDVLMEIDGQSTKGKTIDQIGDLLAITPVKMKLKKKGASTIYNVEIKSDSVFKRMYDNPTVYAALILTPETINNPEMVVLKNGNQMESRYLSYYRNAIRSKMEDEYSYNVFWKSIGEKLKNVKTIYLSPDGVYNSINVNTLFNPATRKYVLDEFDVKLVGNTSDLLQPSVRSDASQVVLVGFPDYNQGSTTTKKPAEEATDFLLLKSDTTQRFMDGNNVSELPGTQLEINSIEKIFQGSKTTVNKLLSKTASEENLKNIHSPKVLHIATHGFFLDEIPGESSERGITGVAVAKLRENPLLRSGLLFAGAGKTISNGKDASQKEDGILTAYEAMSLDLQKTDLVVLSACETGLGQIRAGEGVYGLQRAFRSAGAQGVLMSLWKVDDMATQELMTEFYRQWQNGTSKQKAFHDAQVKLRSKFAHPYYWGAFVLTGN